MSQKIKTSVEIDGSLTASQIANATTDTDKFLVSDGGTVKYRTGAELASDLGIASGSTSKVQHQVKAGVAINKGQAVYVTSADGTNMIVGLASNASEATSSKTMGLLNATVVANGFADVVTEGLLDGLNTSTATVGDPVWLGTSGNLIYGLVNKPYAPNHLVFIGIVTRVNANNGEIFVKVQNGFELDEIHDVDLKTTTKVNGHLLGYNGSLWVNKTIAEWLGYTPYNASNPAGYISSYTETDTLASVTGRGALTNTPIAISAGTLNHVTLGDRFNLIGGSNFHITNNAYYDSGFKYKFADLATKLALQADGILSYQTAVTGTIGASVTFDTRFSIDSAGNLLSTGSMLSPIFYDSNNTAYYVDPASTSNLNALNIGNAKLRWGGNTTPTLGLPFSGSANAFWIDVNDGDTGGLMVDNEGVTVYGAGDNGYVFRVIDEDVYQATTNVAASTTFQVSQGQNGGGFIKGNFDISGTLTASGYNKTNWDTAFGWGNHASAGYVPASRTITINGTSYDLSANRSWTVTASETDTLATVTSRGALTSGNIFTPVNGGLFFNGNGLYGSGVYGSGNDLWFNAGSTQKAALNSAGDFTANNSLRAPIFYDSNDTTYYGDFASTSNFRNLLLNNQTTINTTTPGLTSYGLTFMGGNSDQANGMTWTWGNTNAQAGIYVQSSGAYGTKMYFATTDSFATGAKTAMAIDHYGNVSLNRGTFNNGSVWINNGVNYNSYNENIRLFNATNGVSVIAFGASGTSGTPQSSILGFSDRLEIRVGANGTAVQRNYDNYVEAMGSSRAPIFYDSNNTGYYVDPASTSNLNGLTVTGTISGNISGSAGSAFGMPYDGNGISGMGPISTWDSRPGVGMAGFGINWHTGVSISGYGGYGGVRLYASGYPTHSGSVLRLEASDSVKTYGTFTNDSSVRSPIFYDSNDTTYYVDPAGSATRAAFLNGNLWINPKPESYGEGVTFNMPTQGTWGGLRWYRNGSAGNYVGNWAFGYFGNESNNDVGFHNGTNGWRLDHSFNMTATGSVRSPVFYDSNDTSYYLDPNNTSRVTAVVADNLYSINNIYLESNYGSSVIGLYNSTRYQGVYSMGSAYKLALDGTTTGNLYGLAWAHPNAGGVSGNLNTHGLLAMENGTWLASLTGSTRARDDMRAPIFYDNNDTTYYSDPASTSGECARFAGGIVVSRGNVTGNGIILADDGDIVDLNDGYCAMRFSSGVRIHAGNRTGGVVHTLHSNGTFTASGDVVAYSDERVKENINTIEYALDKVKALRGVTYNRTDKKDKSEKVGVIAQEIKEVLPQVVFEQEDGMLGVSYGNITAVLIEAIKEQQTQIEELKELVNKLINK